MTEAELIQRAILGLEAFLVFSAYFALVHFVAWLYGRADEEKKP